MMWTDFEHQMWALFKEFELENRPAYFIAASGGLDSMALLHLVTRLRPNARIRVAHYHHGPSDIREQINFRDEALAFVKHKISELNSPNIVFISQASKVKLNSEAQMREARWNFLSSKKDPTEVILTGHHRDDWFEGVLLKMIRGTSLAGAAAMQIWKKDIFRPFLKISKLDIKAYADQQKIKFLEDPSNLQEDYLRNWLRQNWLQALDAKQPGGSANLSRSLLQMIEDSQQHSTFDLKYFNGDETHGLDRAWFLTLSSADQLKALAMYLKSQRIFQFTCGQLHEVSKRLDKNQKEITFELFERKWVINATQIMLE